METAVPNIDYKPHNMTMETVNECFAEMLSVSKNFENILYRKDKKNEMI